MDDHGLGPETITVEISPTEASITRDIDLGVSDRLILRLAGTSGSTGYSWDDLQIGDPTVLKNSSCEYVPPPGPIIGGEGTDVWTFEALREGSTTIAAEFRGPGPATGEPACSFKANVAVRILLRSNQ
ncbi:protease inhibitor I42 family protein [Mycobacterium sp. 050134]|uniref:protease inhibitor I42 family protein n=1 Tax=Mycobacterium sp. 050134 TaxID=3096111 RepID=UPI003FA60E63